MGGLIKKESKLSKKDAIGPKRGLLKNILKIKHKKRSFLNAKL